MIKEMKKITKGKSKKGDQKIIQNLIVMILQMMQENVERNIEETKQSAMTKIHKLMKKTKGRRATNLNENL